MVKIKLNTIQDVDDFIAITTSNILSIRSLSIVAIKLTLLSSANIFS